MTGSTSLVWLRRDLRVHDHPALTAALESAELVLPVFVLDRNVLDARLASGDRTHALLTSLEELRDAIRQRGGTLAVRLGDPLEELLRLIEQTGATEVHATSDVSPFALRRDARVAEGLAGAGAKLTRHPGLFCADISKIRTKDGRPYTVFSPFGRNWTEAPRRAVLEPPERIASPTAEEGLIPTISDLGLECVLTDPLPAGEAAARERMEQWLSSGIDKYKELHDDLARNTSCLSHHLHLGTLSARELEQRAIELPGKGPEAFRRQIGWRDFYAHILLHFPGNASKPFQQRFEALEWVDDPEGFTAWCAGRTGYPLVDAGMRELAATGSMHNRTRMVVASFLTKDLHVDWRLGEQWFAKLLLDGDAAQNNGNWQWTASLGVDPQPYFKRIFNPILQQRKFDSEGVYVRRWVPELANVPLVRLFEPWTMTEQEQADSGCLLGVDYPHPIVDHAAERARAIERYRAAAADSQ
jgi:deoxyribodipyrimidine photo-lyase